MGWIEWTWQQTPALKNVTPVIAVVMTSTQDNNDTDFKNIAAGTYDVFLYGDGPGLG